MSEAQLDRVLKALAEPRRREILRLVAEMERACPEGVVCQSVLEKMEISQSTFSHHVEELFSAGLLHRVPVGRQALLTVNRETLGGVSSGLLAGIDSGS